MYTERPTKIVDVGTTWFSFFDIEAEDFLEFSGRCVFKDSHEFIEHLVKDVRCMSVLDGTLRFDVDCWHHQYSRFYPMVETWEISKGIRKEIRREK